MLRSTEKASVSRDAQTVEKPSRSEVVTTVRTHSGSTVGPIPIAKYPICISVLRDEVSGTRRTRLEVHVSQDFRQCGITS